MRYQILVHWPILMQRLFANDADVAFSVMSAQDLQYLYCAAQ
jgi:hypothetical protein